MKIIVQSLTASILRPKYHHRNKNAQWYVYDTETKKTVYGVASRNGCQKFIDSGGLS